MQKSLWKLRHKICFKLSNCSLFKIKCFSSCSALRQAPLTGEFLWKDLNSKSPFLLLQSSFVSSLCQTVLDNKIVLIHKLSNNFLFTLNICTFWHFHIRQSEWQIRFRLDEKVDRLIAYNLDLTRKYVFLP